MQIEGHEGRSHGRTHSHQVTVTVNDDQYATLKSTERMFDMGHSKIFQTFLEAEKKRGVIRTELAERLTPERLEGNTQEKGT